MTRDEILARLTAILLLNDGTCAGRGAVIAALEAWREEVR